MSAYRSAWTISWFAILAVGACWAGMTMPATAVMGAFAVGVGSACGLGIAFLDDDLPTRTQLCGLFEPATWAGATAVSASVLSIWRPGAGALLVLAVLGTCPKAMSSIRARCAAAGLVRLSIDSQTATRMSLVDLVDAWLDSQQRLDAAGAPHLALQVVLERAALLDEIERRMPSALTGGDPAGS